MSDSNSTVTSLVEREAITNVLYRAVMGFDNNDFSLVQAALSGQDFVFDLDGILKDFEAIRTDINGCVGPMDTTHMISNIQVEFKDDFVFDLDGILKDFEAIRTDINGCVGPMDTTHMISNIQVEFKDGASTASLTALALAQHCPPQKGKDQGSSKFLTGSKYFIDLVKDKSDGSWKIKKWVMRIVWTEGDHSIMQRYA
ncbi:uncharacterized protein ZBAI_03556 [Zygosaccharomyces bailii ISA1307]|nr:uncharacterized protein ZBAI_03556 [Zygosaccharomyces bailii ISA1307]